MVHKVYYWRGKPNFGDRLNWTLLHFLGAKFEYRENPAVANLVIAGSILEHLPEGWSGTVCGAGKLHESSTVDLRSAKVVALRGPLTAAGVKLGNGQVFALGDPMLLVPDWIPQNASKYDLGIVAHWSDTELRRRFPYGHFIDVTLPPEIVVRKISLCKRVISSSLHGLVVADAYGIPRQAEIFARAAEEGGDFKFRDYAALYDTHPHFGQMWCAPRHIVERIKRDLRWAMSQVTGCSTPHHCSENKRVPPVRRGYFPMISLLVPFRNDNEERARIWNWLRQYWMAHLPRAEIVEGHDHSYPFSKACAVNDAASRARGRVFVILDADTYLDSQVVQHCAHRILKARRHGRCLWFVPYDKNYRLTREFTHRLIHSDPERDYRIPSPPPPRWVETPDFCHYGHSHGAFIQIMHRKTFFEVGGMDCRFRGWGSEDAALLRALDTLCCQHEVTRNDVMHLWHVHPGHSPSTRRWVGQNVRTNCRLAQRYAVATGEPGFMRALVNEHARRYLLPVVN